MQFLNLTKEFQDLMERFSGKFETIRCSRFRSYEDPKSLHQHLMNCLRVKRQEFQKNCANPSASRKEENKDEATKEYDALKAAGFPLHLVTRLVESAYEKAPKTLREASLKQSTIDAFIIKVPKQQSVPIEGFAENDGDTHEEPPQQGFGRTNDTKKASIGVRNLYALLELEHGELVSWEVETNSVLNNYASELVILLKGMRSQEEKFEVRKPRPTSKFNMALTEVEEEISTLKIHLSSLAELFQPPDLSHLSFRDRRKAENELALKIEEASVDTTESMRRLKPLVKTKKEENRRKVWVAQRKNKLKKSSTKKICVENPFKTIQECMDDLNTEFDQEDSVDGLSVADIGTVCEFFKEVDKGGRDFAYPSDLLKALGRPKTETKATLKAIIKWLPIASINFQGREVLVDANKLFNCPIQMSQAMMALGTEERKLFVRPKKTKDKGEERLLSRKKPCKLVKGYMLEQIKVFVNDCGVSAQVRRRDEAGYIGFTMPQVNIDSGSNQPEVLKHIHSGCKKILFFNFVTFSAAQVAPGGSGQGGRQSALSGILKKTFLAIQ